MKDKIFVDSNIWLYLNESNDDRKKAIVLELFPKPNLFTSPQVIFECINVCRRKFSRTLLNSIAFVEKLINNCTVLDENTETTVLSLKILEKYKLQTFDSKIIATALYHNCTILYSEDMQNGLVIEDKLTILNPFLNK